MKKTLTHLTFPIAAGDSIPGHRPNDPCALKGRWREPIFCWFAQTWHVRVRPCRSLCILSKSLRLRVAPHVACGSKNTFLPNEPKLKITKHCKSIGCKKPVWLRFQNEPIFPGSLRFNRFHSRLPKPVQGFLEKRIVYFHCGTCCYHWNGQSARQRKEGKCT
jgi:hypothetical protein